MTTTKFFFRNFAAMASMCFITFVLVSAALELKAQTIDQLSKKQGTDFPANFLSVVPSGQVFMEMKMVFWSSAEGYTSSTPLGYVQVEVEDSFNKDYSALSGSSEFTINFDPNIIDFGKSVPSTNPARIGILELKYSPGGALQVRIDGGKTTLCFPLGYEIGEEELRKLVRLVRTKDGQLAAMVTFNDTGKIFASLQPGIRERICMVLPLQDSDPVKTLKLARDKNGISFALLLLRDGNSRAKATGTGKANLGVTVLTPSDKAMAEKIGMTIVVVN